MSHDPAFRAATESDLCVALGITPDQLRIARAIDREFWICLKQFVTNARFDHLVDPSGRWESSRKEIFKVLYSPTFDEEKAE